MKKLILILAILWLTACTDTIIEDGDVRPTVIIPTTETTAVPITPTANLATKVPVETAVPPLLTDVLQPIWPIADGMSGFLLGGSHNGEWIDPSITMKSLQDGERPYQLYAGSTFQGTLTGQPATILLHGPCGGTPTIPFPPGNDLSGQIAIVAGWEAAPRQPQALPLDTAVYQEAVAELLQAQGIADPEVRLTSVNKIDLEGDGVDEVLITASRLNSNGLPTAAAGDYSLAILRKVVNDTVITIPLDMKLFPEAVELADPAQFNILAMLDLNGNGKLEIVLEDWYYESRYVTVYESNDANIQAVLTAGCGP